VDQNKPYLAFIHLTIILAETLQRYVSRQLKVDGTAWSGHKMFQTLQSCLQAVKLREFALEQRLQAAHSSAGLTDDVPKLFEERSIC
jgi:hypothetical protein